MRRETETVSTLADADTNNRGDSRAATKLPAHSEAAPVRVAIFVGRRITDSVCRVECRSVECRVVDESEARSESDHPFLEALDIPAADHWQIAVVGRPRTHGVASHSIMAKLGREEHLSPSPLGGPDRLTSPLTAYALG